MIERSEEGPVAILRLAHGKASALDLELLEAFDRALAAEERSGARAVVLTGTGSIFSAGVDLRRVVDGGARYLAAFLPALDRAFVRLARFEKPLVAAVNGHAIAGGALIAFGCDRRILARGKATFGAPELKVGVPFPVCALELARAAVGPERLSEVLLAARVYAVDECLARGLVDEVVEPAELGLRARAVASELAAFPPRSFALTKRRMRAPMLERLERDVAATARETLEAWSSPEVLDAIRAYVEATLRPARPSAV